MIDGIYRFACSLHERLDACLRQHRLGGEADPGLPLLRVPPASATPGTPVMRAPAYLALFSRR
jgi:hypothetical protein